MILRSYKMVLGSDSWFQSLSDAKVSFYKHHGAVVVYNEEIKGYEIHLHPMMKVA